MQNWRGSLKISKLKFGSKPAPGEANKSLAVPPPPPPTPPPPPPFPPMDLPTGGSTTPKVYIRKSTEDLQTQIRQRASTLKPPDMSLQVRMSGEFLKFLYIFHIFYLKLLLFFEFFKFVFLQFVQNFLCTM